MRAAPVQAHRARRPRGEWPLGQPLWHKCRSYQEGLDDEGALPKLVQALRDKPAKVTAKGDGKGWEIGHPNL